MEDRKKTYRDWNAMDGRGEPVSPEDALPPNDLVFFLLDTIPLLDLSAFHSYYAGDLRGQPPFDVTMMVTLLVYSYAVGVVSSRKIAAACERNLAFRAIVGHDRPDFRTISDFRKNHREAFEALFIEVLRLAGELGMVRLGNLSTDGTKMKANASRHKAMSYGYMAKEIARLKQEIEQLLKQAEKLDAEQDAALGSRRGDELPDELGRREGRLERIQEAQGRLEQEAAARAAEEQRQRDEAQAALANLAAAGIAIPCDSEGQRIPIPNTADSGYFSEEAVTGLEAEGFDPYIATGRQKHHTTEPITTEPATAESGSAEDDSVAGGSISTAKPTVKERMSQKLRGAAGKKIYAARKAIIEPVFGQIKQA